MESHNSLNANDKSNEEIKENQTPNSFTSLILQQHDKGHLALHMVPDTSILYDKLDDRRILNNLREDVGTDKRNTNYQLYTIISGTILPAAKYPIEQRLHQTMGKEYFVGINLEKVVIRNFYLVDAWSDYKNKNKRGRPTYTMMFDDSHRNAESDIKSYQQIKRLDQVDKINERTAQMALQPTYPETELFGDEPEPPTYIRAKNEILMKINSASICCIGTLASNADEPLYLLSLIHMQKKMYDHTGVVFPIFIYNNSKQSKILDNIDSESIVMAQNEMYQIDVCALLKKMANDNPKIDIPLGCGWPDELNEKIGLHFTVSDFVKFLGYKMDVKGDVSLPNEHELNEKKHQQHQLLLTSINKSLDSLTSILKPYSKQDHIKQIHKVGRSDVNQSEIYDEINQVALNNFVRANYFPNQSSFSLAEEEKIQYLVKAYNLEFRLNIYKELLSKEGSIVNYTKLTEDLNWSQILLEKISKTTDRKITPV